MDELGERAPAASPASNKRVAFFDLDGTLVRGHTQLLLVQFMRKEGAVGRLFVLAAGLWFLAYKLKLVKLTRQARERGAMVFKGFTPAGLEPVMTRFAEEVLAPRLRPGALEALDNHKAQGERVVILSAALEPVVKALCRQVGADDYRGAECEIKDSRYTGRICGTIPHAGEKTRIAASLASQWEVVADDCWAYADHETDRALLRWAGHPVAVDPRPGLLATAVKAGWPILR